MPPPKRARLEGVKDLAPILKPVVEPVLARLDRHEELLQDMKAALEVQFKRTAAIQAQLDHLIAALSKPRSE